MSVSPIARHINDHYAPEVAAQCKASYQEARRHLAAQPGPLTAERVASITLGAQQEIRRSLDEELARGAREDKRVGCAEGCSHCCWQSVEITMGELVTLVHCIHVDEHPRLRARAQAASERRREIAARGGAHSTVPCPLLEKNRCGAYELRPQACATHFSYSRAACDREWRSRFHARTKERVPMPMAPKALGAAVVSGLQLAFHAVGLEEDLVDLADGLAVMLAPGAVDRWLAGERMATEISAYGQKHGTPYDDTLEVMLRQMG